GFCMWLNDYGTGPQLTGARTRVGDGGCSCHSGCLGRVRVQFRCADNLYSMRFPVQCSPPGNGFETLPIPFYEHELKIIAPPPGRALRRDSCWIKRQSCWDEIAVTFDRYPEDTVGTS